MLFNSFLYLILFLPVSLFFYYRVRINHFYLLILVSIIFYAYWKFFYIFLIIGIISFNYYFGKKLINSDEYNLKFKLIFYIFFNILILCLFKYLDFFIENINFIFKTNFENLNIPYPLAISFVTFQQIIFLVDCYDKKIKEFNFRNYFLFIIFFPQLIAGPITRFNNINNQFSEIKNKEFNFLNFSSGMFLISIGLFKKIILSDGLANITIPGFENYYNLDTLSTWLISISFTFQFYFDFSAYSDFALGSALLFNIKLPQNFNSPLKATSIIDFWQRWHMTLTFFLTNYVFFNIARKFNNLNFFNSMIAIFITFMIAGIWHGPAWTFFFFGIWHGIFIILNHTVRKLDFEFNKFIKWTVSFLIVIIGFIIFRSENMHQATIIILKLFFIHDTNVEIINILNLFILNEVMIYSLTIFFVSTIVICLKKNSNMYIQNFKTKKKYLVSMLLIFILSFSTINSSNEFIYFNF